MQSSNILCILIAAAACSGSVLHSVHLSNIDPRATSESDIDTLNQLAILQDENDQLKSENLLLRQSANTLNELNVPEDYIEFLENNTGLKFKSQVDIIHDNEDARHKSAELEWVTQFSRKGMENRSHAFTLIGLMPPNELLWQLGTTEAASGARRAIYDHERKLILIPKDFDIDHIDDLRTLMFMVSVALVEQNYPQPSDMSDDSWNARRSIILSFCQQTAEFFKSSYARRLQVPGMIYQPMTSEEKRRESMATFESLPGYVKFLNQLPNFYASQLLDSKKWRKSSRKDTLEYCLSKATTTKSFFNFTPTASTSVSKQKDEIFATSLGAIAVFYHFERFNDNSRRTSVKLAKSYATDRLSAKPLTDQTTRTEWKVKFTTIESAQIFAEHLKQLPPEDQWISTVSQNDQEVSLVITEKALAE